ncbi:uncharacterized protein PAC_14570 [Phialocephala subalpina]|uniref:Uncharacterized protein n=1 Tax=Phialocephala subalpina TaxID=576137 RepID=A0A1L7XI14_9HELO|nr:uncharacterized protein PAC_14570 [Phialocephala subalpina]
MGTKNGFVVELKMPAFHGMWLRFRPTTPPEALPSTRLTPFRESSDFHDDGAEARTCLDADGILGQKRRNSAQVERPVESENSSLDFSLLWSSPRTPRARREEVVGRFEVFGPRFRAKDDSENTKNLFEDSALPAGRSSGTGSRKTSYHDARFIINVSDDQLKASRRFTWSSLFSHDDDIRRWGYSFLEFESSSQSSD